MSNCYCNGSCAKIKKKKDFANGSLFAKGFVNCNNCSVYLSKEVCVILSGKLCCPCCHQAVRFRPRHTKRSIEWKAMVLKKSI